MANQDGPSAVNFQSEQGDVDFQPEANESGGGLAGRITEAAQNVDWPKVGIGVGAVAAVAGAAYAAKRFVARDSEDQGGGKNNGGR